MMLVSLGEGMPSKPVTGGAYGTHAVTCGGCRRAMRFVKVVAIAHHTHVSDTIHTLWECDTEDCGNVITLEDDHV